MDLITAILMVVTVLIIVGGLWLFKNSEGLGRVALPAAAAVANVLLFYVLEIIMNASIVAILGFSTPVATLSAVALLVVGCFAQVWMLRVFASNIYDVFCKYDKVRWIGNFSIRDSFHQIGLVGA